MVRTVTTQKPHKSKVPKSEIDEVQRALNFFAKTQEELVAELKKHNAYLKALAVKYDIQPEFGEKLLPESDTAPKVKKHKLTKIQ